MQPLFPGEPQPLPEQSGPTWTVTFDEHPSPAAAPVRHATGYMPFLAFAEKFGTDPHNLVDLWAFAHFVRGHRARFDEDTELLRSAIVFLGNVLIANHPECCWTNTTRGLGIESELGPHVEVEPGVFEEATVRRSIVVGQTVPALLAADEARFLEFHSVVDRWKRGAPPPPRRPTLPSQSLD